MATPAENLRAATASAHRRLEALPFARELREARVDVTRYAAFLRALHEAHEGVVRAFSASFDATLRALAEGITERLALLRDDLAHLGADPHAVDAASLRAALLAQRVRRADPNELFGYAYVLEGSRLGGIVLADALASVPELHGSGRAYLGGLEREVRAAFDALLARLGEALARDEALEGAVRGARRAFDGFASILGAFGAPAGALAEELNVDAGSHSLPVDLREVEAALLAGEATWSRYAYYGARYGARGRRFTRSDSAWLASLVRAPEPEVVRQVLWLGRVLASRGMPRRLLEEHLRELERALVEALPERAERYAALAAASERLREARTRALPEALAEALIEAHGDGLLAERGIAPREAASLLVAALADERDGIPHALRSLTEWLLDPARFSARWLEAGRRTLDSAFA